MASPYQLSSTTILDAPPEIAFQTLVDAPLEELFPTRSGLVPAVAGCEGQEGAWGHPGQTRTVLLADGSRNHETLVAVDRPTDYRYSLTGFTGPMRALVTRVDGRFSFVPEAAGTRATWSWAVHPRGVLARLLLPPVGWSWRIMARTMWPRFASRLPT